MTIWTPSLDTQEPLYRALADAIDTDTQAGKLSAGERLPTHRDLADALGVTVGTISRGYAEAERRGLTTAVVGRGTFVRDRARTAEAWPDIAAGESGLVNLTISLPVTLEEEGRLLAETLETIAAQPHVADLLNYVHESATPSQKTAARDWLQPLDLHPDLDQILATAGSQHSLNIAFANTFLPGQVILAGELAYPSIKTQARTYGLKLRPIAMDDQGIIPDALEQACRLEPKPHGLYIDPTLQNPTSALMSQARRDQIAEIADRHDLWLIEDDVHAFLLDPPERPIAARLPHRTIYLASVAKCLSPGLRTGYLIAPAQLKNKLLAGIHTSMWMPPPLMLEVTTNWLQNGTAAHIIQEKRKETQARQHLADQILADHHLSSHPNGYQIWLELPDPWTTDTFVTETRERGVKVVGAGVFAISRRNIPNAVRLSIGKPTRAELKHGLQILQNLLNDTTTASY